ncbi:hypothetical protein F511_19783 [Dorcoceras hygrometricum]|uniref:Uncharacterized protein n=1 Tax=Dorcoceras hygrometricum TaxID=472368 RepID=A0A2Z7AJG5_9LAMI|nr:hypothetical protein F511_19783 [Dorcoceras hygrometricum]
MPPRRRGRGRWQFQQESEGQNEEVQRSGPFRRRDSQIEVDELVARVDDMELVMARFQRMNPQMFNGDESSSDAESWLQHIIGLFDRVKYDDERRLSLDTFQLRRSAERWWRDASRTLEETGVGITWNSFCLIKLLNTMILVWYGFPVLSGFHTRQILVCLLGMSRLSCP